jgi:hypothetical protein
MMNNTTTATTGPSITPGEICFGDGLGVDEDEDEDEESGVAVLVQFVLAMLAVGTGTSRLLVDGFACQRVKLSESWSTIRYAAVRKYRPSVAGRSPTPAISTSRWLVLKRRNPDLSTETNGTTYWSLDTRISKPESRTTVMSPSNLVVVVSIDLN